MTIGRCSSSLLPPAFAAVPQYLVHIMSGFPSRSQIPDTGRRVGEAACPVIPAYRRFTLRSVLQPSLGFHPTPPHGDAVAFRSRLPPIGPAKDLHYMLTSNRSVMPSELTLVAGRKGNQSAGPPCGTPRGRGALVSLYPCPAPAGPRKTAPAPRQRLTQAGCRVSPSADGLPWCRASGFASREARLPPPSSTGSFHQQIIRPAGTGRTPYGVAIIGMLTHFPESRSKPAHHPWDPGRIPCVSSSRAGRSQRTNTESCPRLRPDAATSAMLTGSRHPTVAASRTSCLPCRHVAAFQTKSPPASLNSPACRPPCGRPAVRILLLVLTGSGKQSDCHCGRSVNRPQFGCVNRAAGSRPCHPSANPLSRLPQPDSRRLSEPPTIPSTRRTPRRSRSCPAATPQARPRTGVP